MFLSFYGGGLITDGLNFYKFKKVLYFVVSIPKYMMLFKAGHNKFELSLKICANQFEHVGSSFSKWFVQSF